MEEFGGCTHHLLDGDFYQVLDAFLWILLRGLLHHRRLQEMEHLFSLDEAVAIQVKHFEADWGWIGKAEMIANLPIKGYSRVYSGKGLWEMCVVTKSALSQWVKVRKMYCCFALL